MPHEAADISSSRSSSRDSPCGIRCRDRASSTNMPHEAAGHLVSRDNPCGIRCRDRAYIISTPHEAADKLITAL